MKTRIWISLIGASVMVALIAVSVQAHHSIPAFYDESRTVSVTGVVKSLKIMNPHSSLTLEVGPAGRPKDTWLGIMGSGSAMGRNGWTNDTIKAGTTITIEGNPARAEGARGMIVKTITTSEGREIKPGQID